MTDTNINEIVTQLAKALEKRDYGTFTDFFSDDAIFEIPFTVDGGTVLTGLPKIKEHFENINKGPLVKLVQINTVTAKSYINTTSNTVTIEFFTEGKALNTEEHFKIQSSIALVQFNDHHIVHYKDFPNTIGIAKKAGILPQLAAAWTK